MIYISIIYPFLCVFIHIFPFKTDTLYDWLRGLQLVRRWAIIIKESLSASVMTNWINYLLCKCEGWTQIPETQIKKNLDDYGNLPVISMMEGQTGEPWG